MSRIPNADAFKQRYREILQQYQTVYEDYLSRIRSKYAALPGGKPPPSVSDHLEHHHRVYIVNALLAALNWRLEVPPSAGLPELTPEAPLRSLDRGTIRFLDYLGVERETVKPLLIVETKRLSADLPLIDRPGLRYSDVISGGLAGDKLSGQWNKWLRDLKDYVRSSYTSAGAAPRRVVLTNADWIVLFLDPEDSFLEQGRPDPNSIVIFEDSDDIEDRSAELYRTLEHRRVLGGIPSLLPGEVPSYLSGDRVDRAMHGLRVQYNTRGLYVQSPAITVAPILFLRSIDGAWVRIEDPPLEFEIHPKYSDLVPHIAEVEHAAKGLFLRVSRLLGRTPEVQSLSEHFGNEDRFSALPAVVEEAPNQYLLATGQHTHYLLPEPTVSNCAYHDWYECKRAAVQSIPGPLHESSTAPRSFFKSGEVHHCAHRDVTVAKAASLTKDHSRCGPRSGHDGQAFCEIWRFEERLCCRTCAFEAVCSKTQALQLPCKQPSAP